MISIISGAERKNFFVFIVLRIDGFVKNKFCDKIKAFPVLISTLWAVVSLLIKQEAERKCQAVKFIVNNCFVRLVKG